MAHESVHNHWRCNFNKWNVRE